MPCYHPSVVSIKRKTLLPGSRGASDLLAVGCGHCLGCRADQARQWATRILHESYVTQPAYFLTLTYADEHLPQAGSLDPQHLRAFWKSLRRQGLKPRYYGIGEYGDLTQRPHYHAALFGVSFPDRRHFRTDSDRPVWKSGFLDMAWPHGHTEFSGISFGSASYVAGYVRKKQTHKGANPDHYLRVDPSTGELHQVEPEFARISSKPAIGLKWLHRYWSDVYPCDEVIIKGQDSRPPRYYDKAFFEFDDDKVTRLCGSPFPGITFLERQELALQVKEKRLEAALDRTEKELERRENLHKKRIQLFQPRNKL